MHKYTEPALALQCVKHDQNPSASKWTAGKWEGGCVHTGMPGRRLHREQEIAEFKSSTLSFVFVPRNPKYGYGDEKEIIIDRIHQLYLSQKGEIFLVFGSKKKRKK